MNFSQYLKYSGKHGYNIALVLNLVILTFLFIFLDCVYNNKIRMPVEVTSAITSDLIRNDDLSIVITGENLIYINNGFISLQDLREFMKKNHPSGVYIKIDRKSSMGILVDIWNIARSCGITRINIASNAEE